ncbi:hypothetical protein [Aeromicrobium sp.]|uniref:hypothetical protein n=1 Tax=Aeromicrobium sp. TaxID=1871063 RepID=UPI0030C5C7ED
MRSKWSTILAGVISCVVLASVALVLASPDGSVGDDRARPTSTATTEGEPSTATPSPSPSSTATTAAPEPSGRLAPASVRGPWPGRPDAATADGSKVDWCPAVRTTGAAEAQREFGKARVLRAACAAVSFIFDRRYSRLSLPRSSYAAKDLDFVLPALTESAVRGYRPRINTFLANPDSVDAREDLGLVLFRGEGTAKGAKHASAGRGRVFYGTAFTTKGYRHRDEWINPKWSRVRISVDRSKAEPRIVARLEASASAPVFNTSIRRHDMVTVPTSATFFLRREGRGWRIGGWDITSGSYAYRRLALK